LIADPTLYTSRFDNNAKSLASLAERDKPSSSLYALEDSAPVMEDSSSLLSVTSEAESSKPLGPRWDDYSFREADLFYNARPNSDISPFQPQPDTASSSETSKMPSGVSNWKLVSRWNPTSRKSTVEEKGFSVVRPSRIHSSLPQSPQMQKEHDNSSESK
jgi:hypothetical protein